MRVLQTSPYHFFYPQSSSVPLAPASSGTYKALKRGIRFFDSSGTLFAFLVANQQGEIFFVSATRTAEGIRYMHALSTPAEETLGVQNLRFSQLSNLEHRLWEQTQIPQIKAA